MVFGGIVMSKIKGTFKGNKKTKKLIPNLTANPNHICFKDYEEGKVYKEFIQIVNQDSKIYHLGIKFENPDEIKVTIVGNASKTQLGRGDDILLEVEFTPTTSFKKESVDRRYEISLSVVNANARFHIPILVLSPHPDINLPREITLPDVAVNTPAYSNIFVLNYTSLYTKFSFECRNEVKIIPDCKAMGLKACEGSTYLVELIPKAVGSFREKIYICMENDKRVAITLKCTALPINIFLNEDTVEFSPTFIGMSDRKLIHIVNNSEDATFFEWLPSDNLHSEKSEKGLDTHPSLKYVEIHPLSGELQPGTVTAVDLTFRPEDSEDDAFELVKNVIASLALRLTVAPHYHPSINVKGLILGPSFQLDRRAIDLQELFTGECRSIEVNVSNIGIIGGKVLFQKPQNSENDGIVRVSPTSESFKAGECKSFKLHFLARRIGKFVEQAFFKVKNGEKLSFVIQGTVIPLEVSIQPEAIKFPLAAICVPQMHFLKLTNPLPFDIDVSIECEGNGCDDPLEFLEFFKTIQEHSDDNSIESSLTRTSIRNFMEHSGRMSHMRDSLAAARDGIGAIFNKASDYLEKKEIVTGIMRVLFDDTFGRELEKRFVVETIVELLIGSISESDCRDFVRFCEKDWLLPSDPRQIECSQMSLKLAAGESKDLKIFLTPNQVGKFTRNLQFHLRITGAQCNDVDESIRTVPVSFECQGADVKIHNQSNEITGYAESEITLEVLLENLSPVDGFFYFVPHRDTQMEVRSAEERFHIPAGSQRHINLHVTPLMSGQILKYVSVVALGSNRRFPICIDCKSLPPDIVVKPSKICHGDLTVLRQHDTRIFIENRSDTKARFFLQLERERACFSVNPRGGILSSKQCVVVMLEKFFHDPGDYRDVLVVEIVNSKVIKIPIKCTVKKLPIIIEPALARVIDFGTLFVSKTPYFLDYKFTNGGRSAYMIFLVLKNWRNRTEIRFTMEPSRFELSPNCSQVVKFLLNAEHALGCEEEFTVEGCSIHYPIRELIWESKLKASVIRPTINFTSNELIFNCYYGEVSDLSFETIDIVNKSNLPLPVALKVEGEFSIYAHELRAREQKIMFDLKVHESRSICICFNSNLIRKSSAFRAYEGRVKAYSLGKLQCTLKLIANLIYPEIELSTHELQFTANVLPCACSFVISNPNEHLPASFEFTISENATKIVPIHERRQENLLNIVQCLMRQKNSLRDKFFRKDDTCWDDDDNETAADKGNDSNDIIDVTTKDILEHLKSIIVKTSENYSDGSVTAMPASKTDESFLLLSQMSGRLKAKESRLISLYFSGSTKAFNLSSMLKCRVLGGHEKEIRIQMTNCNPNILVTKTYFDISQQRWQEIAINSICISNISPSCNTIKLIAEKHDVVMPELIEGYVKFSSRCQLKFTLDDQRHFCCDLKFSMFPGCRPIYRGEFGVQVNEKPPIPVSFFCKNSIPMATLLDVDRESLHTIDKSFEYECLREMHNKCVERTRVADEVVNCEDILRVKARLQAMEDEQQQQQQQQQRSNKKSSKRDTKRRSEKKTQSIDVHSSGDGEALAMEFALFFGDERGRVVWRERPHRMCSAKVLQLADEELEECGFTALDYPDEYPHAIEIMHFIAQHGFAKSLESDETFMAYRSIYNRYAVERFRQMKKSLGQPRTGAVPAYERAIESVESLPLTLLEYSCDFGDINIDEPHERAIRVYCHHRNGAPVAMAIRCARHVPNFNAKFHQRAEINNVFEARNYEEMPPPSSLSEAQCEAAAVKRCHSFDFAGGNVHTRSVAKTARERNEIHRMYSAKSGTRETTKERDPLVLAEIRQRQPFDGDESRIVEFSITFAPSSDYYGDAVTFDEMIYLDIHLGPQIPLRITGKFNQCTDHTVVDF